MKTVKVNIREDLCQRKEHLFSGPSTGVWRLTGGGWASILNKCCVPALPESVVVCIRRRVGRTNREIFQPTRRKRVGFVFHAKFLS